MDDVHSGEFCGMLVGGTVVSVDVAMNATVEVLAIVVDVVIVEVVALPAVLFTTYTWIAPTFV